MPQHEHFLEQHDPDRKDFQVDRIILFSDAVFAIAITLLIIEIKTPNIHELPNKDVQHQLQQLSELWPKFMAFTMSFFVIAVYWRSHHRIFGFVNTYTEKLIWINILFLFAVVVMPFSSAYYSENYGYEVSHVFYNLNIIATGLINYFFIRYVFNPANKLVKHQPTPMFIHLFKARAVAIPIFFSCIILLGFFGVPFYPIIYALLWPMFLILRRYNARKYADKPAQKRKAQKSPEE
ncbi:TMEM175 family protein [Mucilaginibacter sp. UYCu711]|uniref:TMEM175 family protein n=1 Tax=Mucilaginibacter sp. UYCu711 TaxID=3156339 RepID=UPI003D21D081